MNYDIPLKHFDIVDEHATECVEPVVDTERIPLVHCFRLLFTCLTSNEEISEETQYGMIAEAGINPARTDGAAEFLSQQDNE